MIVVIADRKSMRPGTGALPTAIATPPRRNDRRNLSPPHFSALHFSALHLSAINFSANDTLVFFRFFLLSPKNHLSVLSVRRKKENKTKKEASPRWERAKLQNAEP